VSTDETASPADDPTATPTTAQPADSPVQAPAQAPAESVVLCADDDERWPALRERIAEAMSLSNSKEYDQVVETCRAMLTDYPFNAEPYMLLGLTALLCGDEGQALSFLSQAHETDPDTREYVALLAMVSTRVGKLADAVYYAKIAEVCEPHPYLSTMLPPDYVNLNRAFLYVRPSSHNLNGQRALNVGQHQKALKEFMAEVRVNPDNVQALYFLCHAALHLGNVTQAVGAAQSYLHHRPDSAMGRALLARALIAAGREGEAVAAAEAALSRAEDDAEVFAAAMTALQACPTVTTDRLKAWAAAFNAAFDEADPYADDEDAASGDAPADAAVHIGVVSNTFHRTAVSDYATTWIAALNGGGVRTTGFQFSVLKDAVTTTYQSACDSWRDMVSVDPYTLATILERESLDAVIDLSTPAVESCATTLALKPSPIRIGCSALAEPGLSPGVSHILSDESLEYGDRAMALDGQTVLSIPGTLYARAGFDTLPQDTPAPMTENGFPTFGLVARTPHVSPGFAQTVGLLLLAVPGSRLLVYGAQDLDEGARAAMRESFMNAGVADRLLFVERDDASGADGEADDAEAVMRRLEAQISPAVWREVDVLLDTYPLNAGRELIEALWSGVPVVTRRGPRRASCVGASIVNAAGRPEWVADSEDAYVRIAADLVRDADALAAGRADLQARIASSGLFNPRRTARAVRDVLVEACRAHRAKAGG
jgi:protein O-GlcNAc transferase